MRFAGCGGNPTTPAIFMELTIQKTDNSKPKHVFLVVTAGDGKIHCACAESIMRNIAICRDSGIKITPYFHSGDCYISRARNWCSRLFMQYDYTDMIFVDSDVAFDDNAMVQILKHDVDFVAGVYPYRSSLVDGFPCQYHQMPDGTPMVDYETGLIMATSVPAGFMRLRRAVFTRLSGWYESSLRDSKGTDGWFDGGMAFLASGDRTWYGEDNCFCMRYRAAGGSIWIEPRISFTHIGFEKFTGNFDQYLRNLPKPDTKPRDEFSEAKAQRIANCGERLKQALVSQR
jgi:hypothetical protein